MNFIEVINDTSFKFSDITSTQLFIYFSMLSFYFTKNINLLQRKKYILDYFLSSSFLKIFEI